MNAFVLVIPAKKQSAIFCISPILRGADQSDANWEQVRIAFVDGWAAQYQAVNG